MKHLNIRLHDTFGCTLVGTALIQSLKFAFPNFILNIYTQNPDLLQGLPEADTINDANIAELNEYDVDIRNYLAIYRPQESKPLRHLYQHMLEIATKQLSQKIYKTLTANFYPKIYLTQNELLEAQSIVNGLRENKPIIWLQTKTSSESKDWNSESWEELKNLLEDSCSLVDLSKLQYTKRQSIGITKYCDVGVTLDTFLLHGSKAISAKNTIALLTSSHKEVVTYPDQFVFNAKFQDFTPNILADKVLSLVSS